MTIREVDNRDLSDVCEFQEARIEALIREIAVLRAELAELKREKERNFENATGI